MSSELLQQAMIDATALKEAAMKNAENALIEKYSQEFNQTVQKLLEQEDAAIAPPASMGGMPPPADAGAPAPEAGAQPDLSAGAVDPMADMSMGMPAADNKAFSKVKGAFSGDDEMVTINFDQIQNALNEMLNIRMKEEYDTGVEQDVTDDALAAGATSPDIIVKMGGSKDSVDEPADDALLDLDLDEEGGMAGSEDIMSSSGVAELEEVELEEDTASDLATGLARKAQAESDVAKAQMRDAEEKKKAAELADRASQRPALGLEEDITLTEEELQELAEELKVDIDVGNPSDGYMGTTTTQKREQRNTELAAARDAKATEDRKVEKEKMIDLMKESVQLKKMGNEALETINMLKEQLEKMNLQNAKLLYTNKALGNISLNERQKQNIVESISKADSVLAAKTIYETVQNAVENNKKEPTAPQSLRETLNRAASPFVVRKTASTSDVMAERLKALAGITKK